MSDKEMQKYASYKFIIKAGTFGNFMYLLWHWMSTGITSTTNMIAICTMQHS